MRKVLATLFLVCAMGTAFAYAADIRYSVETQVAQAVNPNPFNSQPQTQTTNPQTVPPIVVNTPEIKFPPFPQQGESWVSWIFAAIGAVATMLFGTIGGKIAFGKPPAATDDPNKIRQIIEAVVHHAEGGDGVSAIGDPNLRAIVGPILRNIVASGVPGSLIQSGASLIPGAGPILARLEPMLRNIVLKALDERLGTERPAGTSPTSMITPDLITGIESIVKNAIEKHFKPGA